MVKFSGMVRLESALDQLVELLALLGLALVVVVLVALVLALRSDGAALEDAAGLAAALAAAISAFGFFH